MYLATKPLCKNCYQPNTSAKIQSGLNTMPHSPYQGSNPSLPPLLQQQSPIMQPLPHPARCRSLLSANCKTFHEIIQLSISLFFSWPTQILTPSTKMKSCPSSHRNPTMRYTIWTPLIHHVHITIKIRPSTQPLWARIIQWAAGYVR